MALASAVRGLRTLAVRKAEKTFPTGNPNCAWREGIVTEFLKACH
jgi:hypothetical protein